MVATSGTSGQPKGVVLTHEAVAASALATSARLGIDPTRHTWLACLPLAHIGGLAVVTRSIVTGTPVVVLPGFEAEAVEEAGRSGRVSHVSLVATALRRLDPSVFACVLLGGSKAPDALPANVVSTYGMTETGSGVVYDGRPLDGVEVSFRPADERMPAGRRRRACGRRRGDPSPGPDVVPLLPPGGRRTSRGPRRRAGTGSPPAMRGGWTPTGSSWCPGRIEDVITTGAEKVWPDLVERTLMAHPGVAEVAVWKRSDPEWGERVVAWVVPTDDAPSLDELRQIVADGIAPWAAPKELVLVDDLPRTAAGKVRRRELDSFDA